MLTSRNNIIYPPKFNIFLNSNLEILVIDSSNLLNLESYRSKFKNSTMSTSRMRDNVERWLIHESLPFNNVKSEENSFQVLVKHAGPYGIPIDIFEPKKQPGIIVVGSKVIMKNNQIVRYLGYTPEEKQRFEKKMADYCYSIQAIHKMLEEDGKQKIGVYVVLDDKVDINQQTLFEAVNRVSEMNEKTARFLLKTV